MRHVARLLDANANRAREALRVMEDAARFLLDDRPLAAKLKVARHALADALRSLSRSVPSLELHRDTPADVGTSLSTPAERSRASGRDVVVAAGKRLTEALRCLEEFAKPYHPAAAGRFKALRYRGYELERLLHLGLGSTRARQWRLCVILTEHLCTHHPWLEVARASIDAGADCLQLREKSLGGRELLERALRLVRMRDKSRLDTSIIINDHPDIALMSGADGVHLGEHDPPPQAVRRLIGPERLIGVSTHSLAQAQRAVWAGADYCGVGAIFATVTKSRRPSGLAHLRAFLRKYPQEPHLAIGGITPENVAKVVNAGARGLAVSSAVCSAPRPGAAVKKLLRALA